MMTMMNDRILQIYLESLPAHEAVVVKRRLDSLREDCGCRFGSIVMLIVTISWVIHTLLMPIAGRAWQSTVAIGLAVLFASALIGKLVGLGLARVRLYLAMRRLHRRLCGKAAQKR
ncbi:hypothetical protein FGL86_11630 [Pistricoccus aurantiacus]|uniref:Transmembrane protein n=1 Tax=Pistricoccus aurantiacus TaxID=1883414 RepID=A0A5B8SXU5_9GAMM|nr:hypothetical protein [Pistricoccus aurantiacus]QEA39653.1 hypothetical protein FGL86_11630 [Pistricoccus aurantiacus]